MPLKKAKDEQLHILQLDIGEGEVLVRGLTPLIANRLAEKARHELLLPKKKTTAERQSQFKHVPVEEYRNSVYMFSGDTEPTRIFFPSGGIKKALMESALEIGGASKASIARLLWMPNFNVGVYGVPRLMMSVTRSADINRTPDIRTRAVIENWAMKIRVNFVRTKLSEQMILNLFTAAGLMIGIGDWRVAKGSASFGQFGHCSPEEFEQIASEGGRVAQDEALANPVPFDLETSRLLAWYDEEVERRTRAGDPAARAHKASLAAAVTNGARVRNDETGAQE